MSAFYEIGLASTDNFADAPPMLQRSDCDDRNPVQKGPSSICCSYGRHAVDTKRCDALHKRHPERYPSDQSFVNFMNNKVDALILLCNIVVQ
jgi:hypothetical protein